MLCSLLIRRIDRVKSNTRMLWILLFLFGGFLTACSKPPKKVGETCLHNIDCDADMVCLSGKCAKTVAKPALKAPIAHIGGLLKVKVGSKVLLDGSRSVGYSGSSISYEWTLTAPKNSKAKLNDSKTSQIAFTADLEGKYTITLKVKDMDKESQMAQVEVEAFKENVPPEVKIAPQSKLVKVGDKVDLDGSGSSDADKDQLTFKWTFKVKPKTSKTSLSNSDTDKADFTPDVAGTYVVNLLVDDGNGGKVTDQSFITATQEPPTPKLTKLSPEKAAKGETVDITIEGENFVYGVAVTMDKKKSDNLRYVNDKKIIATYDLSSWNAGKYTIKVSNPSGKISNELPFEVTTPQSPTISYVGPSLVVSGQRVLLHIDGTNFIKGAKTFFDGKELPTTFISNKVLRSILVVPKDGTYKVYVENPDKQKSAEYEFIVSSVKPIIDDLSFTRIGNDCKKETIVVTGRNLLPGISVFLIASDKKKYAPVKSTYVSMTTLHLEYDFTKLPKGSYTLELTNTGSVAKATHLFDIVDPIPAPQVATLAPQTVIIGGKTSVYLSGVYLKGSKFKLNGKEIKPAPINRSTYSIELDLSKATAGDLKLEVIGLCNKATTPLIIKSIDVPTPKITSITPDKINLTNKNDIEVRGENFHPSAKLLIDGVAEPKAQYKHSGLFVIPLAVLTTAGEKKITIENPNGKISTEKKFTIDHTPTITKTDPAMIYLGFKGSTVTLTGTNISPKATLSINGTVDSTAKVKSFTKIEILSTLFPKEGDYKLVITNPNNVKSKEFIFKRDHTPKITKLDPEAALLGSIPSTMTITGMSFEATSTVFINGTKTTATLTYNSATELELSTKTIFTKVGVYKIQVQSAAGLKSNEFKFEVFPANSMVLTSTEQSTSLYYLKGVNIRTTSTSSDSTVVIHKGTKEVFRKKASNSYMAGKIYLSTSDIEHLTNDPYEIQVCRPIGANNAEVCSNKLTVFFKFSGSGTSTTPVTVPFMPIIGAIAPAKPTTTFVLPTTNPPTKINFSVLGFYFQTTSKVYINGKDASTITGVKVSVVKGTNNDNITITDYPVAELGMGDSSVEITNDKGRSNTYYLHINNKDFIRIITNTNITISLDAAFKFLFYGENFVGTLSLISNGNPIQEGTKPLKITGGTFSLSSNTWNDAKKLSAGAIPVHVENSTGTKSNTVMMKAINPGDWGKEPLGLRTIGSVSTSTTAGALAPYVGDEVAWRIGLTGFVASSGFGGKGKVLVDNKAITDYTTGVESSAHLHEGYTYIRLKKQTIAGTPRLIPIQLENPGNIKSNVSFATVMPKGTMRLTRIGDPKFEMTWWGEYYPAFCYVNILRPGKKQTFVVLGTDLQDAKFYMAGIEVTVKSYSTNKATLIVDIPDIPDGVYPIWAKKNSQVSNSLLVNVYKDGGIGGVPRVRQVSPLIIQKTVLAKTNNKVRFALSGDGMTKDLKVLFDGKSFAITYVASNYIFAEVDLSNVTVGKHKLQLVGPNGKLKSLEFQIEID